MATRGTVLVVDSDDTAQSAMATIFEDSGFAVVRAYDTMSALCVLAAITLDAVVASAVGTDRLELVQALREVDCELPLIVVTAIAQRQR
ncbi:MAG: hypothetical protein ABMB14_16095 [Myxococcota bacterium]